jgi:galactitol-specific phosphotransferase system IIB component
MGVMVAVGGGVKTSMGITRVFMGVLAEVGMAVGKITVAARDMAPGRVVGSDVPQPVIKINNAAQQNNKGKIFFQKILLHSKLNTIQSACFIKPDF